MAMKQRLAQMMALHDQGISIDGLRGLSEVLLGATPGIPVLHPLPEDMNQQALPDMHHSTVLKIKEELSRMEQLAVLQLLPHNFFLTVQTVGPRPEKSCHMATKWICSMHRRWMETTWE